MKKIFIKKWLQMKPYDKQVKTDIYFLNLANRVKKIILVDNSFMRVTDLIPENEIDTLSCLIASYFEDKLSDTNIWNTFIRLNHKF